VSILGRVYFSQKAEPVDKGQSASACYNAQPALDWSDLESRLRELANLSSELSSQHAVDPHVTLAHDPLALFEQLNRRNLPAPLNPSRAADSPTAISSRSAINPPHLRAGRASEPQPRSAEPERDPLQMLSLLAAIPSKQFLTVLSSVHCEAALMTNQRETKPNKPCFPDTASISVQSSSQSARELQLNARQVEKGA
jgi:hypothetical protein